jgi:Mg2+/citrate symporter
VILPRLARHRVVARFTALPAALRGNLWMLVGIVAISISDFRRGTAVNTILGALIVVAASVYIARREATLEIRHPRPSAAD